MVGDTAYKTPAIAHKLKEDWIALLSTYSRPKTKDGFFRKYEYVYDEYYDCYLCPADQVLSYSTTNRDGYKEYKSDPRICEHCPYLSQCTLSKKHVKVVTRLDDKPASGLCLKRVCLQADTGQIAPCFS